MPAKQHENYGSSPSSSSLLSSSSSFRRRAPQGTPEDPKQFAAQEHSCSETLACQTDGIRTFTRNETSLAVYLQEWDGNWDGTGGGLTQATHRNRRIADKTHATKAAQDREALLPHARRCCEATGFRRAQRYRRVKQKNRTCLKKTSLTQSYGVRKLIE